MLSWEALSPNIVLREISLTPFLLLITWAEEPHDGLGARLGNVSARVRDNIWVQDQALWTQRIMHSRAE